MLDAYLQQREGYHRTQQCKHSGNKPGLRRQSRQSQFTCSYAKDPHSDRRHQCYIKRNFKNRLIFQTAFIHINDIKSIPVPAENGNVYLGDIANVEESIGPITIRRVNKERIINIQSNLTDRPLNEVLQELKSKLEQSNLQCTYEFTGQATSMNDSFKEMAMALSMSLLLIYLLLAVLYESIFTPLIRMFSLPLGIIGAIVCLLLTGNTINLYSLIGILVMDGLVAKNGTLLLDYTLTLMHQGKNALEAVIEAGKVRLKPIFMTALTMVVGMLPTALAMTEGSETRVSMAWVIIGGMITSTVFTLIVIPIIFLWIQKHYPNKI